MARHPRINRLTVHEYTWELDDVGTDRNGFNMVYLKGARSRHKGYVFTIVTDAGVTGEWVGGGA